MNSLRIFRGAIVALSTIGLLAAPVLGAEVAGHESHVSVVDVALQNGGELHGQVVSAQGIAQSNIKISIESRGRQITHAVTDEDGRFSVANLRGGTYILRVADDITTCRVWAENTAPPSASQSLLLVTGSATRAQFDLVRRYGPGSLIVIGGAVTVIVLAATDEAS